MYAIQDSEMDDFWFSLDCQTFLLGIFSICYVYYYYLLDILLTNVFYSQIYSSVT